MPMERDRYPSDWEAIALQVKEEAGWRVAAMTATSDARREVAERLRDEADGFRRLEKEWGHEPTINLGDVPAVFQDVAHLAWLDGTVRTYVFLDRLADLIDPTCEVVPFDEESMRLPHCSRCGEPILKPWPNFCPCCGARITGGGEA